MTLTRSQLEQAVPNLSGSVTVDGLEGAVDIYRDSHGIPHVRAGSTRDAFFGQAFAASQDRLWHMQHDRLLAYGRWAEYAGVDALDQDVQMRRFQIGPSVRLDYEHLNDETRAMLYAYAAGVNAFLQSGPLPAEFALVDDTPERWEPWDCLAVFKGRHILMGVFEAKLWRNKLLAALGPEKTAELLPGHRGDLLIVPPAAEYDGAGYDPLPHLSDLEQAIGAMRETDSGSNNWALSGSRTASGKPLMAGDPHRGLDTPNVYYQNHVACPEFDAVGLSFPGFPAFPHFGHNASVAWCVTHAVADYQDVYVERFRDGPQPLCQYGDEWREVEVRHEVLKVRGGEDVEIDVTVTRHGPVIAGGPGEGRGISFRYTSTDGPNPTAQCLQRMLRAGGVDELDEALRDWVDPSNNFVSIDVHGNIQYLNRGRLPVRSMANAWLPVPGWSDEYEWRGFVPFEEMLRSRNPDTGYIVTANNKIAGDDYPHYISLYYGSDGRARRILGKVEGLTGATVEDMADVHRDIVSLPGRTYAGLLGEIEVEDATARRAVDVLADWDGSMHRDLVAPTVYSAFRRELDRRVIGALLGPLAGEAFDATGRGAPRQVGHLSAVLASHAAEGDTSLLPDGADWNTVATQALEAGVAYLRGRLGDDVDSWQWGRIHGTAPRHLLSASFPGLAGLLDPPATPMSGDGDTPHSASFGLGEPFTVTGTSVARYVFDASDWDNSRWVVPLGASGHPGSSHYADQRPVWAVDDVVPMLYSWEAVEAEAETRQVLKPRGEE